MSAFTAPATLEVKAEAQRALGGWISLHDASPGTTGANEATGGSPAYEREQTTWTDGGDDGVITGSQVTIDVPADTYTHFGVWTLQTGGVYIDGGTITSTTLSAQGQIKVTPTLTES